jgi:malate synthase
VRHGVELDTGAQDTAELVRQYEKEELEKIREQVGDEFFYSEGRPDQSRELFDRVALSDEFEAFLTLSAYEVLED